MGFPPSLALAVKVEVGDGGDGAVEDEVGDGGEVGAGASDPAPAQADSAENASASADSAMADFQRATRRRVPAAIARIDGIATLRDRGVFKDSSPASRLLPYSLSGNSNPLARRRA